MDDSIKRAKRRLLLHRQALERRFAALNDAQEDLIRQRLWLRDQLRRVEDPRGRGLGS